MRNYDAWLTTDPNLEIEDFFCPDCEAEASFVEDADEDGPCGYLQCDSCDAKKKGIISLSLLEDIELDGINIKDAPDFVDTFIASAKWINFPKGTDPSLTEEQLQRVCGEEIAELAQERWLR